MTVDNGSDNLRALWQKQCDSSFSMDTSEIQRKYSRLQAHLRLRKYSAYVICLGESIFFTWWLIFTSPAVVVRCSFVLIILGLDFVLAQIWLDNRDRQKAFENGAVGHIHCVEFYRSELVRQRNFHSGIWFWSRLLALIPGLLLISTWSAIKLHGTQEGSQGAFILIVTVLSAVVAILRNYRIARKHQRQIGAIDTMKSPNESPVR